MQKRLWRLLVSVTLMMGVAPLCRADVSPGDTMTAAKLAQAAALLTPSTRWMLEQGMTMWNRRAASLHLAPGVSGSNGTIRRAGGHRCRRTGNRELYCRAPFPVIDAQDPLAGYKIMWNHAQPPYSIDNIGASYVAHLVNSQGNVDQSFENSWRRVMWTGRLYADPKPHHPAQSRGPA